MAETIASKKATSSIPHASSDDDNSISDTRPLDDSLPPDGGLIAWTQVVLGALVNFNTFGFITSFGSFQNYYSASLHQEPSAIAWIGSIQICLVFLIGVFSGRAVDAGHHRLVLGAGAFLQLLGVFMASISTEYYQVFLSLGLCNGTGMGLLFCPTIALIAAYFTKKRALALSSSAAGGGAGGLAFSAIARQLIPSVGIGWTLRIMGFVMLFNFIFIVSMFRSRIPPRKSGPLVELAAFREPTYLIFICGMFLIGWGVYVPYYYVASFAQSDLGFSDEQAYNLLLIINGMGIPGRLIPAMIADRAMGPLNVLIPTAMMSGALIYIWIAVNNSEGIYAFTVVYGYVAAGVQSLFAVASSSLTPDLNKLGVRVGMLFTVYGICTLTGEPLAGALISANGSGYVRMMIFGGTVMVGGSLLLVAARLAKTGLKLKARV